MSGRVRDVRTGLVQTGSGPIDVELYHELREHGAAAAEAAADARREARIRALESDGLVAFRWQEDPYPDRSWEDPETAARVDSGELGYWCCTAALGTGEPDDGDGGWRELSALCGIVLEASEALSNVDRSSRPWCYMRDVERDLGADVLAELRGSGRLCPRCDGSHIAPPEGHRLARCYSCGLAFDTMGD